ncbi:MAG: hypothetical protein ONB48_21135 [candidate division KSB1 bacterium]|nr:hypothetical protein [candidate division KSB1 bacterium]MDZ7288154.1 hypothetical protein [candidate division KSB1 bacterium]MDZ7300333.1 hypothetical protein [candidate division KSB1 bacterium]MDZ7306146.1 hypothetical protein [candidate division KSB1 bacterium]MDZ7351333.1 hypothetical protein [candidate division KSB1 bacterium]
MLTAKRIFLALTLCASTAAAQFGERTADRLILAGSAGIFRIHHNNFTRIYGRRSGPAPGGAAVVKIRTPWHLAVKYRHFALDHAATVEGAKVQLQWRERWINAGVRFLNRAPGKMGNFFGFGLAFFRIEETGPLSLFPEAGGERNTSGFFIDLGLDYRFAGRAAFFVEFEITSATPDGGSGFEGASVGGYLLSAGLNLSVW